MGASRILAQLFGTSRPLSWINTAYPFAAAYLLGGGRIGWPMLVGTVFFLIPYNLLMYGINDVFDYESDLRNPRKGGVEGIVLDRRMHRLTLWAAPLSCVPFVAALIVAGNRWSVLVLAISIFAVVAYSAPPLRFKERPLLDSITSSTHFVSPAVYGLVLVGAPFSPAVLAALAAFFCWGIASQAFGAVQDIGADREAGLASIGTWLGAAGTVRFALAFYAVAAVLLLGTGCPGLLACVIPLLYVANIWPFRSVTDAECELTNAAWRRFLWLNLVSGFLVTQLFIWIALR